MIKKLIQKWVMKRPGLVIGWLVRTLVAEMYRSGISYTQINKWLRRMGHEPVKGYLILPNKDKLLYFGEGPTLERKKELGGRYVHVEV